LHPGHPLLGLARFFRCHLGEVSLPQRFSTRPTLDDLDARKLRRLIRGPPGGTGGAGHAGGSRCGLPARSGLDPGEQVAQGILQAAVLAPETRERAIEDGPVFGTVDQDGRERVVEVVPLAEVDPGGRANRVQDAVGPDRKPGRP